MAVAVVAAVAIAVAAPYLAPELLFALGIAETAVSVAIATAVIGATLSIALAVGVRALGVGTPSAANQVGPPQVFRQSLANSFLVYGKRRVGGLMVFFHGFQGPTGAHWRYFAIAVSGNRCAGLVDWMLNDEIVTVDAGGMVTSGKYANNAWLWFKRGVPGEAAWSVFVAECGGKWTSNHIGEGCGQIYAKFKLENDTDIAGMPNITAIIEGMDDIWDPRVSVSQYTRNPILIFYSWMKTPRDEGGFGAYPDEIPSDAWISAQANICDEVVNGQPRYAMDAVITTGAPPNEIRDAMIVNMAGSYTFSGGKHLARPGYYVAPSETLAEADLAGPIQVSPLMTSDKAATEVQGTYISPDDNYQGAPFTTQLLASPPADIRQLDVDLAFTTNKDQADRIARIMLNRAQATKMVVWPSNIMGMKVRALDTVQVDSTRYSLNNYAFAVVNWSLSAEWGAVLTLREENEDIYGEPAVVAPVVPPSPTVPTDPVMSLTELQSILRVTYPTGLTITQADAGASATIQLSAFNLEYPGQIGTWSIAAHNITGNAFLTDYFPYIDVFSVGDTSPTFGATTVFGTSLNSAANPYRISLQRTVATIASGGTGGGVSPGGGGYGGSGGGGGGTVYP